jgi:hypothetical protein
MEINSLLWMGKRSRKLQAKNVVGTLPGEQVSRFSVGLPFAGTRELP